MNLPTTDELKYAAAEWLSKRRCYPIAVEVRLSSTIADVCGINELGRLVEVEVKRSISDLRNDNRKWGKHSHIRRLRKEAEQSGKIPEEADYFVPSRFYFAVPKEIELKARQVARKLYPYAGVISVSIVDLSDEDLPGFYDVHPLVTKSATWIHHCKADGNVLDAFHRSMTWRLLASMRKIALESKKS